jgi:hypothetical protein
MEVTKTVEEWIGFFEDSKKLLLGKTILKSLLKENIKITGKIYYEFQQKEKALLEAHVLKDDNGEVLRKDINIPLEKSSISNIQLKDEKAFEEEYSKLLTEKVTLPILKIPSYTKMGDSTVLKFLENTLEMTAMEALFLMEEYLDYNNKK